LLKVILFKVILIKLILIKLILLEVNFSRGLLMLQQYFLR
jgi:hypothetical protein